MAREAKTLLAAFAVALLVYVVMVGIVFVKIRQALHIDIVRFSHPLRGDTCIPSRGVMIARPPQVDRRLYWSLGALVPALWVAWEVYRRTRRRDRERLGLCVNCGTELPEAKHGRCPKCRRRYENRRPGRGAFSVLVRPRRVLIISGESSQNYWPVMFPAPSR
jgi:hypothetical protein